MRLWMVDPKIMCRQHLLGEHLETHMFVGSINKGTSMDGYLRSGLLEIHNLRSRHDALVTEMVARGYNHKSPLPELKEVSLALRCGTIDRGAALDELVRRCSECHERWRKLKA